MEFWVALGIEQTKDEEVIHAAYREKLQLVHPEDHPEEFMQLREAYDEALRFARQPEESEEAAQEATPIDLWIGRVEEVYNNFSRRVNVDEWKKIFADEVCQGLDSRIDARNALLKFCMDKYYMPNAVWQYIIDTYSIRENYDALCEIFPKAYIDNAIIGGAEWDKLVPYELFDEGITGNPDVLIELYHKARDERKSGNLDASAATMKDLENCGFDHPYIRLAAAELAAAREENEKAVEIIDQLAEQYPNDTGIRIFHGEVMRHIVKDYERGLADYEAVLAIREDHQGAKWGKAECLLELGKLEEAKDIYLHLHQRIPYDNNIIERIDEINNRLVEEYERKIAESPDDFELCMDYAWNCLQRKEYDKVREIMERLPQPADLAQKCDLNNFATKFHINSEEYEKALSYAMDWEDGVKELPEGETDKEKKRKGKLGEILYLQSAALLAMEKYDEALEKTFASEEADSKSTDALDIRRRVYHRTRQFDKAVEVAEKVTRMEPGYTSWFALGYEQHAQGDKSAAYHSFGEALDYARVMQAYVFRSRILCDFEEWDALKESIDFLVNNGVEEDNIHVRYLRARLDHKDGEKQKALDTYLDIIKDFEESRARNEDYFCDYIWEVYHLAADIKDDFDHPREEIMAYIDRGLTEQEDYFPLLELKNYMLHKAGMHKEVIELNKTILRFYPRARVSHERIADAHYYLDNYAEAVEEYLVQEKIADSAWVQEVLGICLMYLERYDEAENHYRKAIEMAPERIRPRANLGLMFERRFNKEKNAYDFELSLPLQQECVRLNDEQEEENRKKIYRTWLARCLARMERYDEAMVAYRKNLELYGDDEDARKEVELYMESGRFAEGEKLLDKYHEQGKLDEPYLMMKADFRRYQGKERDFIRYINKMPDGAKKLGHLANFYNDHSERKNRLKAMELYRQALDIDPERIDLMNGYIRLLREFGKKDDAEKWTKKAFEQAEEMRSQGWRVALYLTKMAMIYLAAGEPDKAKPYIDRAMTAPMCDHCRYRRCKDAYLALKEYYMDKEMYEEAAQTCREAAEFVADELDFLNVVKRLKKERKIK